MYTFCVHLHTDGGNLFELFVYIPVCSVHYTRVARSNFHEAHRDRHVTVVVAYL